jgi:hypothetical protein
VVAVLDRLDNLEKPVMREMVVTVFQLTHRGAFLLALVKIFLEPIGLLAVAVAVEPVVLALTTPVELAVRVAVQPVVRTTLCPLPL